MVQRALSITLETIEQRPKPMDPQITNARKTVLETSANRTIGARSKRRDRVGNSYRIRLTQLPLESSTERM